MGRSITTGFVRAGARVAMLDVNEDWLEQSANDLREIGGDDAVLPIVVDVTSPESVQNAVQRTISEMGGLHILVNNAGINARTGGFGAQAAGSQNDFWTLPPDAWLRVIDVNLSGPFLMSHAVAPHMIEQGFGRIIGVTTSMDTMWRKGGAPYGPSKAGHEALVAIMAQDFEGTGVTANVLTPGGATATNMVIPPERRHHRRTHSARGHAAAVRSGSHPMTPATGTAAASSPTSGTTPCRWRSASKSAAPPPPGRSWALQAVHPDWYGRA